MKSEDGESLKEIVKLYYGDPTLTEDEKDSVNEMLESVEQTNFLDKCRKVVDKKEKDNLHLGKLHISKVACLVAVLIIGIVTIAFAFLTPKIKEIHIIDKGNHCEIEVVYNKNPNENVVYEIKDYYKPIWVPEGYRMVNEHKDRFMYTIYYESSDGKEKIIYHQFLPFVKTHFSGENGKHEKVSFGKYSGEYIETYKSGFLVVTDGTYLYMIYGHDKKIYNKETLLKMLYQ